MSISPVRFNFVARPQDDPNANKKSGVVAELKASGIANPATGIDDKMVLEKSFPKPWEKIELNTDEKFRIDKEDGTFNKEQVDKLALGKRTAYFISSKVSTGNYVYQAVICDASGKPVRMISKASGFLVETINVDGDKIQKTAAERNK